MKLKKIITAIKDSDPCKECLIRPICRSLCETKRNRNGRLNSYWVGFSPLIFVISISVYIFSFAIANVFYHFGLLTKKQVNVFDPFLDESQMDKLNYY